MLKITSKYVVAIGITPRIDEYERDRIREFLDGTHPMSPIRTKYDTGTKRKTVLDQAPVGPEEIVDEEGDRTSHDNIGSGFKEDREPGGRADDETGPGFTHHKDPEQDFAGHSTSELAFKNDFDLSNRWSPLNYESNARDSKSTDHLMRLHSRPRMKIPHRTPVDSPRRNTASTWSHIYV